MLLGAAGGAYYANRNPLTRIIGGTLGGTVGAKVGKRIDKKKSREVAAAKQLGRAINELITELEVVSPDVRKNALRERRKEEVRRRLEGAVNGGLIAGGIGSLAFTEPIAEVGKPKVRKNALLGGRASGKARRLKIGGGLAGLVGGSIVGAMLSARHRLDVARGIVHSYLIEHGESVNFERTRKENPGSNLNPNRAALLAGEGARYKKVYTQTKKSMKHAKSGQTVVGDILDYTHRKAQMKKRQILGVNQSDKTGQWRIGGGTSSSVRLYKDAGGRTRRKKYFWEKKATRDKIAAGAVAGSFVGGIAVKNRLDKAANRLSTRKAMLAPGITARHKKVVSPYNPTRKEIVAEAIKGVGRDAKAVWARGYRKKLRKKYPNAALEPHNRAPGVQRPSHTGELHKAEQKRLKNKGVVKTNKSADAVINSGKKLFDGRKGGKAATVVKHPKGKLSHQDVARTTQSAEDLRKTMSKSKVAKSGSVDNPLKASAHETVNKGEAKAKKAFAGEADRPVGGKRIGGDKFPRQGKREPRITDNRGMRKRMKEHHLRQLIMTAIKRKGGKSSIQPLASVKSA